MRFLAKILLILALVIYLAVITKLILFKGVPLSEMKNPATYFQFEESGMNNSNITPFETIKLYWYAENLNLNIRIGNLLGNVIGFVPFGFMLPLLTTKLQKIFRVTFATLYLSLLYEITQFITGFGSFDVDDLILNTLGGILGYVLFKIFHTIWKYQKRKSSQSRKVLQGNDHKKWNTDMIWNKEQ